jgi:hypothetical protein
VKQFIDYKETRKGDRSEIEERRKRMKNERKEEGK